MGAVVYGGFTAGFPGQRQLKVEQAELARLRPEVIKLKAQRDMLRKAAACFAKEAL